MGEGARERGRRRRGEEEEVDIFRAAPNQLLRQFVSVGARGRGREPRKFNTKNQYAAHSLAGSREEAKVKGRTGKRQDETETHDKEGEKSLISAVKKIYRVV